MGGGRCRGHAFLSPLRPVFPAPDLAPDLARCHTPGLFYNSDYLLAFSQALATLNL